jgi:hypothetical protein
MGRVDSIPWPSSSPDISVLTLHYWGYIKSADYGVVEHAENVGLPFSFCYFIPMYAAYM